MVLSFFVEASPRGDLDFNLLAWDSITRGGCTEAFTSKPAVQLGPCGDTSLSCDAAFAELVLSASSVPSGHTFITVHTPEELLNWCGAVMMGVTMVGDFLPRTFTHDELLV